MRFRFVTVNGVRTRIATCGEAGPTLLLVHGFGALIEHWYRNIDALGENCRVIAVDLLGHGFTDPVPLQGQTPHRVILDHLIALLDTLDLNHVIVCGSSFGSLLSCHLYLEAAARIDKLILCGSGSLFNSDDELARALPQTLANAKIALTDTTVANCLRRLGNSNFDGSSAPPEAALAQAISLALPGVKEFYLEAMSGLMSEAAQPYRLLHRLKELTIPTLVVWGREDPRGLYHRAVELVPQMPNATLVTFERCGHKPFMEHPAQFHRAVCDFVL